MPVAGGRVTGQPAQPAVIGPGSRSVMWRGAMVWNSADARSPSPPCRPAGQVLVGQVMADVVPVGRQHEVGRNPGPLQRRQAVAEREHDGAVAQRAQHADVALGSPGPGATMMSGAPASEPIDAVAPGQRHSAGRLARPCSMRVRAWAAARLAGEESLAAGALDARDHLGVERGLARLERPPGDPVRAPARPGRARRRPPRPGDRPG